MRETQAIIERVRRVSAELQHLDLSVDPALEQFQPGQSLFVAPLENTGWEPYLREQWIPVALKKGSLTVERPVTRAYTPGSVLSVLAPVGRPIPLRSGSRQMLMIVEDVTPSPLVWLAQHLIAKGLAVTMVLGGEAIRYPLELLPPEVEILRGDTDWNWPDQVDTLGWADQVIALAPSHAQAESYRHLYDTISQLRTQIIPDGYVSGLFYYRLACGTGACQACQIPCRGDDLLACVDGPAIDLKRVIFR